jgi:prepilin-type processing-associated H-X9-DG protein/prepilin-type N-terminal cleavage/methylation domain-containing protein
MNHTRVTRTRGFSLVELLTVIGIITLLLAVLVPALSAARRAAQTVQCASNLRQLVAALTNYSVEAKGKYPANNGGVNVYWYNRDAIGKYIKTVYQQSNSEQCIGGIFICPSDLEGAVRSYSMNIFASQSVSQFVQADLDSPTPKGKLWSSNVSDGSHMILLIEQFSQEDWPNENQGQSVGDGHTGQWSSKAIVGWAGDPTGKPSSRFVAGGWDVPARFGECASEVCYHRHRLAKQNFGLGVAVGRVNIGFADGHVSLLSNTDLVDVNKDTGDVHDKFEALWSPNDRDIETALGG